MEWTVFDTQAIIVSIGLIISLLTFWRVLRIEEIVRSEDNRIRRIERHLGLELTPTARKGK